MSTPSSTISPATWQPAAAGGAYAGGLTLLALTFWRGWIGRPFAVPHLIYVQRPIPHLLAGLLALFVGYLLHRGYRNDAKAWRRLAGKGALLGVGLGLSFLVGEMGYRALAVAAAKSSPRSSGGFDFVSLLTCTWQTFWANWGTCLVASLVLMGLSLAVSVVVHLLLLVVAFGIGHVVPPTQPLVAVGILGFVLLVVCVALVFGYCALEAGLILLMTRLARGQSANLSDMFAGGEYAPKLLGFHLLQFLIQIPLIFVVAGPVIGIALALRSPVLAVVGQVLAWLVNLVVFLLLLPAPYMVVDGDENVISAFGESARAMSGRMLTALGAFLVVAIGVLVFVLLTLGVGVLLASPFFLLFLAVVYLKATDQRTAY